MELEASTEEASMEEQASMSKVCGRLKGKVMSQVDILTDGQVGYTRLGQGLVRADQEVFHSDSVECESACQDGFRHNSVKQWRTHWSMQIQYSNVQYSTQCSTVQSSAVKLSTVQYQV